MSLLGLTLSLALFASPAMGQTVAFPDSASEVAATSWLALVDSTLYEESWDAAAPVFQQAVTSEQWSLAAAQARGPMGALQSRSLRGVQTVDQLPNMPPADYLLVEYTSRFTQIQRAVETHVLVKGDDDVWRTVGYFVRPVQ